MVSNPSGGSLTVLTGSRRCPRGGPRMGQIRLAPQRLTATIRGFLREKRYLHPRRLQRMPIPHSSQISHPRSRSLAQFRKKYIGTIRGSIYHGRDPRRSEIPFYLPAWDERYFHAHRPQSRRGPRSFQKRALSICSSSIPPRFQPGPYPLCRQLPETHGNISRESERQSLRHRGPEIQGWESAGYDAPSGALCAESWLLGSARCGEVGGFWAVGEGFSEREEVGWVSG